MILYGRQPIREALGAGRRPVRTIWATNRAMREPWLRGVDVTEAPPAAIEQRCGSSAHQGICAEVGPYPYIPDAMAIVTQVPDPLVVALDELEDPQNVGAICRTAEAVGADGVILPERRSAEITPAVCKASAGAVEHLAVARVGNLANFLLDAKQAQCWIYGAAGEADGAVAYTEPDYRGGVVLVLGAEGKGLRPRVASTCDQLVALPMRGQVGSLNVSAAAAALLYAILQKRLDTGT